MYKIVERAQCDNQFIIEAIFKLDLSIKCTQRHLRHLDIGYRMRARRDIIWKNIFTTIGTEHENRERERKKKMISIDVAQARFHMQLCEDHLLIIICN